MKSTKQEKQSDTKKSIVVVPSRVISRPDNLEGGEETEIAANINVPGDPCWGWVVTLSSCFSMIILDGIAFTFGSILPNIVEEFGVSESLVALINSVAVAIYLISGPLGSALINRFGFRACGMGGSIFSAFALFISVFVTNFTSLFVFYGVVAGFGYGLINMTAGLVVGFYFEKLRAVALAISACGSSLGVMICYPMNSYLTGLAGWRAMTLFHSGLIGSIYFMSMAYRPLLALTVVKTLPSEGDPTRTVTFLPNLSTAAIKLAASRTMTVAESLEPTAAERLFNAVQNTNFPTAGAVVQDAQPASTARQPGTSTSPTAPAVSKLTITAIGPKGGISQRQLKQVQSMVSKSNMRDGGGTKLVEISIDVPEPEVKRGCCGRCCRWEQHVAESRPMYRDDAFYTGKIENLAEYHKSKANITPETETGLEYQLAVSRATAAADLQERRGVCTTAVRRVLASMLDPSLLRRKTFLVICFSGFMIYLGYLVPFVFIEARNLEAGVDPTHCNFFVSAIGGANAAGRLILGALAAKIDPLRLFAFVICIAGFSTAASNLYYALYFQYAYCVTFGFCIAGVASVRQMVLVSFYGLEKLTNAYGLLLMGQGVSSLLSTPLASLLKDYFGYTVAFYIAGGFIAFGGIVMIPLRCLLARENKKLESEKHDPKKSPPSNPQTESTKTRPTKTDPAKKDPPKIDPTKTDSTKPQYVRPDPFKTLANKTDSTKTDPTKNLYLPIVR